MYKNENMTAKLGYEVIQHNNLCYVNLVYVKLT